MTLQLTKVIGHRGACGYAPENTLISMQRAYELGAKWVEFDVMLAQCNEAIIIHDTSLERTTNGRGEVAGTDYKTIATLDSGSWFSNEYAGQKIPTFNELLEYLASLNMGINVEVKPYPGYEVATAQRALTILNNSWPQHCQAPLISSFSPLVLETIRSEDPHIALGYLIDDWSTGWEQVLEQNNCVSLHVNQKMLTKDSVKKIKQLCKFILTYTVNNPQRAKELFDLGVDSVFTDYPDLILTSL